MLKYAFTLLVIMLLSCNTEDGKSPLTSEEELQMQDLVTSLESFQWQLFQQIVSGEEELKNLNISPLSIAAALYMTYEGSANVTRDKMTETLELPGEIINFNLGQAYKTFIDELEKTNATLTTANAIFWDKNRIFPATEFLDYTKTYFDAGQFDLVFQEPAALSAINNWVKSATQGRIDKIIEEINAEEVMFLINALYFKDDWKFPFAQENTRVGSFTRSDGQTVSTDMIHQDIFTLRYYQGADFEAVEMPFADTSYNMVLLLPPTGKTPDQLITDLQTDRLSRLFDQDMAVGRILLDLPKFEIEYKIQLNDVLKAMGMEIAFDPYLADFSKLGNAPEGNLFISRVNHKTYLKIDEKGAEGAAVTSVGVGVTSLPPQLRFDRPFVFLLRNRNTNALIFAGKIEDPTI